MSVRIYGLHIKTAEDITRCIESIHGGDRWPRFNQCHFKRGYGPKGEYCKIHDPEAVNARKVKREIEYNRQWENSPIMQLERARIKINQLERQIKKLQNAR